MMAAQAASETQASLGVFLGILIGLLSALVLVLLMNTVRGSSAASAIPKVVTELLAFPVLWFGGPWLTGTMLKSVDLDRIVSSYTLSLTVTFGLPALILISFLLYKFMADSGKITGAPHA